MASLVEEPRETVRRRDGSKSRVLLTSVFGPYAQDDGYGSREINPMELYHNQVTRVQGAYSLRTFNRSWGLMLIQVNLQAPCTLLDFPSEERFVEELQSRQYDVVGISSIMTNLLKVRRMAKLIRKYQPQAEIVVGGHLANFSELRRYADVDHVRKTFAGGGEYVLGKFAMRLGGGWDGRGPGNEDDRGYIAGGFGVIKTADPGKVGVLATFGVRRDLTGPYPETVLGANLGLLFNPGF